MSFFNTALSFIFKLFLIMGNTAICFNGICQSDMGTKTFPSKYFIGGEIGINDFHMKDEYLSPLPCNAMMFSSKISFGARLGNAKHYVELYYSHGSPSPDNQDFNITENQGALSYSFLQNIHKLKLMDLPLNLFLGGGISSFVMNSDLMTDSKEGLGYYTDQSWYWSHALNINAEGEYLLSENKTLSVQFQVPFFKIVTRPSNGHWLGTKNQKVLNNFLNAAGGGKGEFFWKNFIILYKIEYMQILNEHLALKGSYRFNYTSSNTPFSMGMYMNNLSIGIDWRL